jgi:hypothetical protein
MTEKASSLVVVGSDDEPLVLTGRPHALTGTLQLHNPSDAKVVLRDAGLRDPSGALRLPEARYRLQPIVLRPDQGGSVLVSVAVDSTTSPGEYRAELEVAGNVRTVVLQVAETVDLSVDPETVVIANRPGVAQKKRLVVTNDGNVPFTIGEPVEVELRRDVPLAFIRREEQVVGTVEARAPAAIEVAPGETATIELALTLVEAPPAIHRYRGRLPVVTHDVDVVVVASTSTPQAPTKPKPKPKPKPQPQPKAKPAARRSRRTSTTRRKPATGGGRGTK